ncbi:uncharacterized protein METZ01_LOCUS431090 [marine metagenome]|uniref:Uncharacterized protein n=1 Tax=marine metagenome TaxID=408172 RepID=A0A382Y4K8_9ZZZZ
MADDQKENGQETEEAKPLTLFEEKMKGLLDELDELLEQVGGDYGPILMEELQNRLESIVKNFNDEVHTLFTDSFNKWRTTDSQLREFVKGDVKVPKPKKTQKKPKEAPTPEFIKNVEFGPVRPK